MKLISHKSHFLIAHDAFSHWPRPYSAIDRKWASGSLQEGFFHRNWNFMEIKFCSPLSCSKVIAIKFCTWHDSCAIMACAKFYSDIKPNNRVILKPIFTQIWMTMNYVKWTQDEVMVSDCMTNIIFWIQCAPDISRMCISRTWIYRGRMLDPIFLVPKSVTFFAKSQ